jgi:hypothetical protein
MVTFLADGQVQTNRLGFTSATDNTNYLIHCGFGTLDEGKGHNTEFGTEGTNGFEFDRFFGLKTSNDSNLRIIPGRKVPRGRTMSVWLSYAAHADLPRSGKGFVAPGTIWFTNYFLESETRDLLRESLLLRSEWSFESAPPHVLSTFTSYRDGKLTTDRYSPSRIPVEYRSGGTNSVLHILSWTNIAGLRLAREARITTYIHDEQTGVLRPWQVHGLTATNVVTGISRQSFIPKLGNRTQILDYRFMDGPRRPANYFATNGVILNTWEEIDAERERQRRQ